MMGMAGAGTAGVSDPSALRYNPAALGFEQSQFGGSLGTLTTLDEATYLGNLESQQVHDTGFHSANMLYKLPTSRGSLVFGGSFTRLQTFDRQREYIGIDPVLPAGANFYPDFVDSVTEVRQNGEITEDGANYALNLGSAVELFQGVMIGGALHIPFGNFRSFDRLRETYRGVTGQDLTEYSSTEALQSEFAGVSGQAGLSTEIAYGLQFGLTIETPTYYEVSEDFETTYAADFADGFQDADETTGAFDYAVVTPWRFGAGLAYDVSGLLISADATLIDWTQLAFRGDTDVAYLEEQNEFIRDNLEPVMETRLGAAYRMDSFVLRAGYAHTPDPYRSGFLSADGEESDAARDYISAGISYRFAPQMWIDLSWIREDFDDIYTLYRAEDVVREDVLTNRFLAGLRYNF